jgi:hypothetical protein
MGSLLKFYNLVVGREKKNKGQGRHNAKPLENPKLSTLHCETSRCCPGEMH